MDRDGGVLDCQVREVMLLLFSARKSPTDSDLARDRLRRGGPERSSNDPWVTPMVTARESVCRLTVKVVRSSRKERRDMLTEIPKRVPLFQS